MPKSEMKPSQLPAETSHTKDKNIENNSISHQTASVSQNIDSLDSFERKILAQIRQDPHFESQNMLNSMVKMSISKLSNSRKSRGYRNVSIDSEVERKLTPLNAHPGESRKYKGKYSGLYTEADKYKVSLNSGIGELDDENPAHSEHGNLEEYLDGLIR